MATHRPATKMQIFTFCQKLQSPTLHQAVRYLCKSTLFPYCNIHMILKSRLVFCSIAPKHIPNLTIHNIPKNHRKGIRREQNPKLHFYPASRETHFSFAKRQTYRAELAHIKCVQKAEPEPIRLELH